MAEKTTVDMKNGNRISFEIPDIDFTPLKSLSDDTIEMPDFVRALIHNDPEIFKDVMGKIATRVAYGEFVVFESPPRKHRDYVVRRNLPH